MQILVCPKCHYLTGNDERYCCKCGTRLVDVGKQAFCGSCGAVLMPYAEYCSQCGTKRDAGEQPGGVPCPRKAKASAAAPDMTLERLYLIGWDEYQNNRYVSAFNLLRQAAEQGHPKAQFYLAECYRTGSGVREDEDEAAGWLARAGEQGIDEETVDGDRETLLQKAKRGDARAQYRLGRRILRHCFTSKTEFRQDEKWLSKAAAGGYAPALHLLGACYSYLADLRKDAGSRRKMREKAFAMYREAANLGHAGAIFALGKCYESGGGVRKNTKTAFRLYRKASEAGYRDALSLLTIGLCYDKGIGTARNKKEAAGYYKKAMEFGDKLLAPQYLEKLGE